MLYPYQAYQTKVEGHSFWVAESLFLKGCVGQGETSGEATAALAKNEQGWISAAKESGIPIPPMPN